MKHRRISVPLLGLCLLALIAGCGERKEQIGGKSPSRSKLTLLLDWTPNADHAPIYAAIADGAFERAGIDLEIKTPSDPSAALRLVAARKVDLAISYQPDLLLARDKGARIAAVAALIQKPLTSLMSLDRSIKSPNDLAGKTVGTAGIPYQSAYLETILREAGVDPRKVKEVSVGFNLSQAMISGKVDATLGAFWNVEGVELRRRGKRPLITPVDEIGVPDYQELVFVGQMDMLRENGTTLRRFMQAMSDGAAALKRDPAPAIKEMERAEPGLDHGFLKATVTATKPVYVPADDRFPWGFMNTEEWERYGRWMLRSHLIERLPTPTSLTNEYLPGQGI